MIINIPFIGIRAYFVIYGNNKAEVLSNENSSKLEMPNQNVRHFSCEILKTRQKMYSSYINYVGFAMQPAAVSKNVEKKSKIFRVFE